MTDKELYHAVLDEFYKTGSCRLNEWQLMKIKHDGRIAIFEAIYPSRGNIKIRRPIKKDRVNDYGQEIWLYSLMRFTNKQELKDDGFLYDIRLDQKEAVTC